MSAPPRLPLSDRTNIPETVRKGLEEVAQTGKVQVPLPDYNQILNQIGIISNYLVEQEARLHHRLSTLDAQIRDLDERVRLCFSLQAGNTRRNEELRARCLQTLKELISAIEP